MHYPRQRQVETVPAANLANLYAQENHQPAHVMLSGKYRKVTDVSQSTDDQGRPILLLSWGAGHGKSSIALLDSEITMIKQNPTCLCGCGLPTKGGMWARGHDGRVAGMGKRAIGGDRQALGQLRSIDPQHLPQHRPTRVIVDRTVRCDASCQFAHRELCECSCGGYGHFKGWVAIGVEVLREVVRATETPADRRARRRSDRERAAARREALESARPWAEYTFNQGRQLEHAHRPNLTAYDTTPIESWDGTAVRHEQLDWDQDFDAWLKSVIPVPSDEDLAAGVCIGTGTFVELTEGKVMHHCSDCGRDVPVDELGRTKWHHKPAEEATA